MIQANELRIGNWLRCYNHLVCVSSITVEVGEWVTDVDDLGRFDLKDADPIPLTPEILKERGFAKDGFYYYILLEADEFYIRALNIEESIFIYVQGIAKIGQELKSLHQLQNLFFALTGTELIYKP